MDKIREEQINRMREYIVERSFLNASYNERKVISGREDVIRAVAQFREQLKEQSSDEVQQLYVKERKKEKDLERQRTEQIEMQRFFNHTKAKANLEYYNQLDSWTPEETISISLGRNPEVVTYASVKPYEDVSLFAKQYMERRELISRALRVETFEYMEHSITKEVLIIPAKFMGWAIEKDLEMPAELVKHFKDRLSLKIDWEFQNKALEAKIKEMEQKLTAQEAELADLKANVKELEKPLDSKREVTYQKLVYTYIVEPNGFDTKAKRNTATGTILSRIQKTGLKMDDEALLEVLRTSSETCKNLLDPANK